MSREGKKKKLRKRRMMNDHGAGSLKRGRKKQEECGKETVSRQREAKKRQRRSSWLACTLHLEQDCQKVGSTKSQSHEVRKGRECNATLSLYSFFFYCATTSALF